MGSLIVDTPVAIGRISDHGAQVLQWQPSGAEPVIWLSSHAVFARDVAIRGGVPICFPWFGAGRSGAMSPAHGFARLVTWPCTATTEQDGTVTVVHVLTQEQAVDPQFPYCYRMTSSASFGDELTLTLLVENTDATPFSFEVALHTYLAVGDASSVSIVGLEGAEYHDKLLDRHVVQAGPVTFDGEVDRVYSSTSDVILRDPALARSVTIAKSGSASTIVWNPWVDKSRAMADFGDEEWRDMVCVETGNVGDRAITLHPGEAHEMKVIVSVSSHRPSS